MPEMPSHDEIQRIATAMNALRPDWKPSSLVTFLSNHHAARPYRDLAIAALIVASDPRTQTPKLLNEHGPWWSAVQVAFGHSGAPSTVPAAGAPRCEIPGHESELIHNCRCCRAERMGRDENRTDTLAMPEDQAATNAAGAALVRAALTSPQRDEREGRR